MGSRALLLGFSLPERRRSDMPSSGLLFLGAPPSRPHRNPSRVGVELLNMLIRGALKGFGLLSRDREMVPPPNFVCKGYRGRDTLELRIGQLG